LVWVTDVALQTFLRLMSSNVMDHCNKNFDKAGFCLITSIAAKILSGLVGGCTHVLSVLTLYGVEPHFWVLDKILKKKTYSCRSVLTLELSDMFEFNMKKSFIDMDHKTW